MRTLPLTASPPYFVLVHPSVPAMMLGQLTALAKSTRLNTEILAILKRRELRGQPGAQTGVEAN